MAIRSDLNLTRLEARARRSEAREAICLVSSLRNYRLSVVAAITTDGVASFSVELVFRVLADSAEGAIPRLDFALRASRKLRAQGYSIVHQGDGTVTWEKCVPRDGVVAECSEVRKLLRAESGEDRGAEAVAVIPRSEQEVGDDS